MEFFQSNFLEVRPFFENKRKNKPWNWNTYKQTTNRGIEKKEYRDNKIKNIEINTEIKQKLTEGIEMAVDAFSEMLLYYSKKRKDKIKKWKQELNINELKEFWKMLENYHWILLNNDKAALNVKFDTENIDLISIKLNEIQNNQ